MRIKLELITIIGNLKQQNEGLATKIKESEQE